MRVMTFVSDMLMPVIFAAVVIHGIVKKVNVYDAFIEGAADGLKTIVKIAPALIGLMTAVGILRSSGALGLLSGVLSPAAKLIGFPAEAIPLTLMRLVSSSAANGLLLDIFKQYGPDSFIGRFVSVMMSCTETVFYTLSVYYLSVKITKTRYTVSGALIANFSGVAASLVITLKLFGK